MTDLPTDGKLHDPGVAYAYAGFDHEFLMFKCYTKPLINSQTGDRGVFETEYRGVLAELEACADPRGWLIRASREVVVHARQHPPTPLEAWIVEYSPTFAKFGLPSHFFLDRKADRAELGL